MPLFSAEEMADLHAAYADALPDTCRLKATVETALDTHTWPTTTEPVACAVLDRPGGIGATGEIALLDSSRQKTIVLPRDTVVAPSWRIEWVQGGLTYEVADVNRAGTYGPAVYCECAEVPS
jgi:hypothetical protein